MFELQLSKVASLKNDLLSGLTVALALVPEAVESIRWWVCMPPLWWV